MAPELRGQPLVDAAGRLGRELLTHDRAHERAVGVARPPAAALVVVELAVFGHQAAHHLVGLAQMAHRGAVASHWDAAAAGARTGHGEEPSARDRLASDAPRELRRRIRTPGSP